jgi:hypothetical protein
MVAALRAAFAQPRTVLTGFNTIIEAPDGSTMGLLTAHQLVKTYYAPLLFRPLSALTGARARPARHL